MCGKGEVFGPLSVPLTDAKVKGLAAVQQGKDKGQLRIDAGQTHLKLSPPACSFQVNPAQFV